MALALASLARIPRAPVARRRANARALGADSAFSLFARSPRGSRRARVAYPSRASTDADAVARDDLDVVLYDTTLRDGSQQVRARPARVPRSSARAKTLPPNEPSMMSSVPSFEPQPHPNPDPNRSRRDDPPSPLPSPQVGISLTCDDKLAVAEHLVDLGVRYVEGGYPGSNPKDVEFFSRWASSGLAARAAARGVVLAAFGMTRRRGVSADADEGLRALVDCPAPCACIVAKAWDEQCVRVLSVTPEENLEMIADSVAHLVARGKEVIVDCEHFFDGHKANPSFAVRCAVTAAKAGASHVVLCDTNGGTMPWESEAATAEVVAALAAAGVPECRVGTHAHNDTALAVANSLAGVKGGARMVQGCVNGYGERTGNADLLAVAGNLELKMNRRCLPEGSVSRLVAVAGAVAKACKQTLDPRQAYVGSSAFAHKGGLHVAALSKMPSSYNHIVPELVGNEARSVVSELSGRGNIVSAAVASGREVSKETAAQVLAQIKHLESRGFVLEDAGASVDILFRRADPSYRAPFNVLEFNVTASNTCFGGFVASDAVSATAADEKPADLREVLPEDELAASAADDAMRERGQMQGYKRGSVAVNQVVVKVDLFEWDEDDDDADAPARRKTELRVAEGNGPVNALANALRLALTESYPQLRRIHLRDYKVDLLSTEGTSAAVTRVTMDFADRDSDATWRTVGAHASIIEASFRALVDGMEYGIAQCNADGCRVDFDAQSKAEPAPAR